jgi:hypothetical protein
MEPDIDTSVAHSARVHDYWLGGCFLVAPGSTTRSSQLPVGN